MEKKIEKVTVYKQIPNGTKNIIIFVASDGKEFKGITAEEDCIKHEQQLEHNKNWSFVKRINPLWDISDIPDDWFYASTEKELELIKRYVGFYDNYNKVYVNGFDRNASELNVGDWISYINKDGGDYRGSISIYTFEYVKQEIEKFLKSFPI
jgi:hypothetical protein